MLPQKKTNLRTISRFSILQTNILNKHSLCHENFIPTKSDKQLLRTDDSEYTNCLRTKKKKKNYKLKILKLKAKKSQWTVNHNRNQSNWLKSQSLSKFPPSYQHKLKGSDWEYKLSLRKNTNQLKKMIF